MIILTVLGYFAICAVGAYFMKQVAIQKGYGEDTHAWAVCFFLGIFGYLYIMALPDKIIQSQNQQMIDLLKERKNTNETLS